MDGDGGFQVITEQPYITEGNRKATQSEIDDFVKQLGFDINNRYGIDGRYKNDQTLLNDLTPKNVILTPEGRIIPIDTIMHLNTPVWNEGGKREDTAQKAPESKSTIDGKEVDLAKTTPEDDAKIIAKSFLNPLDIWSAVQVLTIF